MLADFETFDFDASVIWDICIIGSGAAGITIAREFLGTATSVLVLEGGGTTFESDSQAPYLSEIVGLPHAGTHGGRVRTLGGTTTLWAGQALPLFDVDFEVRDWVPFSGWPLSRASLKPYYIRAEQVMQIPSLSYDFDTWPKRQIPPLKNDGQVSLYFSQFAKVPNFATKYRKSLESSPNVTVLTHANVTELETDIDAKHVKTVRIKSFRGKTDRVSARVFIVCCGGIDSARLLLASDSVEKNGVGNSQGVVGRYFQDHPSMIVPITPNDPWLFDRQFAPERVNSSLYMIKVCPSAAFQREHRILNVGAEAYYLDEEDDPISALERLVRNIKGSKIQQLDLRDIRRVITHPRSLMRAAGRRCIGGKWRSPADLRPHLLVTCEQEPNPASRILLSDFRDVLGMRRAVVDWRLTNLVSTTLQRFIAALAGQWRELGIAHVHSDDVSFEGRERGMSGGFNDFNHHIGATRMGNDPTKSVVDSSCRVHGYNNLYIASSSVFPTGGFSNPTLTLLALCLRMADELKLLLAASA